MSLTCPSLSTGLNPRTVNVHIAQLRDFYQYVLHRDWDRYQVPYLHYAQLLPCIPSRQEIHAIIDSFDNLKHKAEIALLYSSSIRVSELCRLHCGDILVSKKCIYISKSKNRSDRYAVLSDNAYRILRDYILTDYSLHSLRHAFGLHLYESGADLMSIKEAMGHKCISSTTVYLTLGIGNGRSVTSPYDL